MRRLVVVGPGLVGGSLGLAARASGRWRVVAVGREAAGAEAAVRAGAADEWAPSIAAALEGGSPPEPGGRPAAGGGAVSAVVVLAVPLSALAERLREAVSAAGTGVLVTDVAGVKRPVARWAEAALAERGAGRPAFVGGHPMAGREGAGLDEARADLFQGAVWVLADPDPQAAQRTPGGRAAAELARDVGAEPVWLTPEAHDRAVAFASQLPQVVALALAATVAEEPWAARLAGGGLRDMTRLAASPARIWTDALFANAGELAPALEHLRERLADLGRALSAGEGGALEAAFAAGNAARRRIAEERGWAR
ncbi:MAG: prephenate dehydrogenase/arogenate dehydrogenase family protein [Clostridia bacterium]|nr:prephenate dehydrogenase/arogenate dehydrogenase family protein [Clostridia bacterium]